MPSPVTISEIDALRTSQPLVAVAMMKIVDTLNVALGMIVTGEVTMVAGFGRVRTTYLRPTSKIFLSRKTAVGRLGHLALENIIPATATAAGGFDITSDLADEGGVVSWLILL